MKLAFRLVSLVVLIIIVVIGVDGYSSFRRELAAFDHDMRRDARLVGRALEVLLTETLRSEGVEGAMRLIEQWDPEEYPLRVRWVWLDANPSAPDGAQLPRKTLKRVAKGEKVTFWRGNEAGGKDLLTYVPLRVGGRMGAIELSQSDALRGEYVRTNFRKTLTLTAVLVLLSSLLTMLLGFLMIGRPLRQLTEKARRLGGGDLSGPLRLRRGTELAALADTINEACEQIAAAQEEIREEADARVAVIGQLRHLDRLKSVGTLAAGIAHELGTPLNVVSGRARLIASGDLSDVEVAESANIVRAQSERMTATIRQLLDFSRSSATERADVDLRQLVERCVNLFAPMAQKNGIVLRVVEGDAPATARSNDGEIQQVLANLITNAVQATPQAGTVEVGIRHERAQAPRGHSGSESDWLCIWVRDEGTGIRDEDLEHLFEPFFTTKGVGEGTGLGLSIAHGIVREHGGWIHVASEVGKGSCFSVYLPQEEAGCRRES